ncbi:g7840 [Coccomyxa viridis]|uniref:G7840 protein n=1 Tax=Coccomyxa viridis TaxID=1274662 RepID=A0ABP1G5J4_9CHLO
MNTSALKVAILVLVLAAFAQAAQIFTREGFNVVGGTIDTRLASLGSTSQTGAANQWIQVATFSNTAASQRHAMTLTISPRDQVMGSSAHTIYLLASNASTGPAGAPVFLMKTNTMTQNGTPSLLSARVRQTQDPSNALSNTYDLFLQLGPDQAFGIPGVWTLTGFTSNDTVAVAEVAPMAALPTTGTAWFTPVVTSAYQFRPMTRFVRIANNVDIINLTQISVYTQDGTNVALKKPVACDVGSWSGLPVSNLVDGVGTNLGACASNPATLEIDLGAEYAISSIVVKNRVDCCQSRTNYAILHGLDANRNIIWSRPFGGTALAQYVFDMSY